LNRIYPIEISLNNKDFLSQKDKKYVFYFFDNHLYDSNWRSKSNDFENIPHNKNITLKFYYSSPVSALINVLE